VRTKYVLKAVKVLFCKTIVNLRENYFGTILSFQGFKPGWIKLTTIYPCLVFFVLSLSASKRILLQNLVAAVGCCDHDNWKRTGLDVQLSATGL
jgi:hypothetical protein